MNNTFKVKYNLPLGSLVGDKLGLPVEILDNIDNINGDLAYYIIHNYGYLSVYDGKTNTKIQNIDMTNGSSSTFDLSPTENKIVIVTSKNNIILWDISINNTLWTINNYDPGYVLKYECPPQYIKFSPDGKFIITYLENMIRIYNSTNGSLIRKFENTSEALISFITCDFSGDIIIAGYSNGEIKLFSTETGVLLKLIRIHSKEISSIAINKEGSLLVSSSWDCKSYIWDLNTNTSIRKLQFNKKMMHNGHFTPITILHNIEFSFDGKYIIGLCNSKPYLWDVRTGTHIKKLLNTSQFTFRNEVDQQCLLSIKDSEYWCISDDHPEHIVINKTNIE